MYVRFKDGQQGHYPVWENVLLVEADSDALAEERARELAGLDAGDSDGTFRWNGRPAEWVFAGIRKILTVSHRSDAVPGHGDEITYSEFGVRDENTLQDLVAGRSVSIEYVQ
jgi:hypothetical protein